MALIPYAKLPRDPADPPLEVEGQEVAEYYCADPHCDCATGHLVAGVVPLSIDVGTGRLDLLDGLPVPANLRVRDALAHMVREGDTLERLRRHYAQVREYGLDHHYEYLDWTQLRPKEFVNWQAIFPRDPIVMLPIYKPRAAGEGGAEATGEGDEGEVLYHLGLDDSYCVDARCDCKTLLWSVAAHIPGEQGAVRPLGKVSYKIARREPAVVEVSANVNPDGLLWMVLDLLRKYPGVAEEHAGRYRTIRERLIPLIAQQRRELEKRKAGPVKEVGRNDPCPCGSGKKYKKCHGSAAG